MIVNAPDEMGARWQDRGRIRDRAGERVRDARPAIGWFEVMMTVGTARQRPCRRPRFVRAMIVARVSLATCRTGTPAYRCARAGYSLDSSTSMRSMIGCSFGRSSVAVFHKTLSSIL